MTKKLHEVTRKDILGDIDPRTLKYSKDVRRATYKGITSDYVAVFETPSVTADPPTIYTQRIKLVDMKDIESDTDLTDAEKVRLAIAGDLEVNCTCPAYLWWGYEYIMTELDAKEGSPQTIFPKVRNPQLEGTVCKHLKLSVEVFALNYSKIAKDIKNKNFI